MPAMTIRKISEETQKAIQERARKNGRSAEAEVRFALDEVFLPKESKLGTWIHERAMEFGGFELEIERDQQPTDAAIFE